MGPPGVERLTRQEAIMMTSQSAVDDRRTTQRFQIKAPLTISLGGREIAGFTRDLSNRGVYFYVGASDVPGAGEEFEFVVELPPEITLSNSCLIRCHGRVARTDLSSRNEAGIAAEILDYRILNGRAEPSHSTAV
jgi:hypothetical protein